MIPAAISLHTPPTASDRAFDHPLVDMPIDDASG
jgi:hypothetical protein